MQGLFLFSGLLWRFCDPASPEPVSLQSALRRSMHVLIRTGSGYTPCELAPFVVDCSAAAHASTGLYPAMNLNDVLLALGSSIHVLYYGCHRSYGRKRLAQRGTKEVPLAK